VPGFGPKTEERILRGIAVAASDSALRVICSGESNFPGGSR
jgi:hypothetical protein